MRELLIWQNQQPKVVAIGGYLGDNEWINSYGCHLDTLGVPFLFQRIPRIWRWGVERHLRQLFFSPVSDWLAVLQAKYRPRKVVIHFHDAWLSGGFLPIRKPDDCAVTCISTFNGIGSHDIFRANFLKRAIHRFLAHRLLKHQCKLVSVDRSNLRYASEFFGLAPGLFTIIPNTVRDLGLRGCPRLSGGREFVVGHVGSITESKGWKILAEAVLRLAARGLPVGLVVAGDGPEQPELQRLCKAYPQTISALGRVPHAGKEVIPKLDALGLISRWEGQPLCILEALCCGVPVIATDVGGVAETIVDGESGFIVARNVDQTAEHIAQWVENPVLHAKMSNCARAAFVEQFHIDQVGAAYAKLYAVKQ
jgi:glycosyltransferase involved in cell wall biosynthesis